MYTLFKRLYHRLSVCCIFCFLPACQKGLLMVRKHENYLKAAKKKKKKAGNQRASEPNQMR